jgi:SAV_6107-like HEPN
MMTLEKWLSERRLRSHETSVEEIADLFSLIERDIADAKIEALSADRRFATAYNAALQLGTVVLRVAGYRTSGMGHHWITFQAISEIIPDADIELVDYFDSCRQKRNTADYDCAGAISDGEVKELLEETIKFREIVYEWLRANHSQLLPN